MRSAPASKAARACGPRWCSAATYNASDLNWFQRFSDGTQQLAGGEHAWDLISQNDQALATGLYLFTVRNKETGAVHRGKFLVIK